MTRRTLLALSATLITLTAASPALAHFHLMSIREVFPGTTGAPAAQYIMLQMYKDGQNLVGGHAVTVYDAAGMLAGTYTFPTNLSNDASQSTILLATTQAQTLFSVTADLVMGGPPIVLAGGKVCWDDIDCVSWGSFAGDSDSPSPSGSQYFGADGLQIGHPIRRDISAGNPALLEGSDDTDDSEADFDCANTATPMSNAGSVGTPYTDATPCPVCGNDTLEPGEQCDGTDDAACSGFCEASCTCPAHDSALLPVKPLKVTVSDHAPMSVTKTIRVKVRNADSTVDSIQVGSSSDCPPGVTVSAPDFDPPNGFTASAIQGGGMDTAMVNVTVTAAAFATFNRVSPARCTITLTSSSLTAGNVDPTSSNNSLTIEVNVTDKNDVQMTSPPHESFAESLAPMTVKIGDGMATVVKKVKPAVGNGDILPTAEDPGDSISLAADFSSCTGITIQTLDMDTKTAGTQGAQTVKGGKKGKGLLQLSFDSSLVSTPNPLAPYRCTATLTATGPTSPPDPEATNNATKLVIDVLDMNDY